MKKIIGIAAVAAMVATSAFADITFSSWGRGIWYAAANQYNGSDNEIVTGMGQSWGGYSPRTALCVHGSSDNVGFNLDVFGNGTDFGMGDNANIWVKPINQFKLTMGKFDDNPLRGDACFGLWGWRRIGSVKGVGGVRDGGEGWTFPGQGSTGVQLAAYPIDALQIYVVLPLNTAIDSATAGRAITTELGHKAAYYAAYTIKDIGKIKAGITGKDSAYDTDGKKVDYTEINAAFDLTAVKNLFVSVGAFIPTATAYTSASTATTPVQADSTLVNGYAKYTMDKLTVHAIVGTKLNACDTKEAKKDGQFGINVGGGVDYAFENSIGVFADVRYANGIYMNSTSADHNDCLTIGAGITKGFSNGLIGVAFEALTNGGTFAGNSLWDNRGLYNQKNGEDFAWAIPVKAEYWF